MRSAVWMKEGRTRSQPVKQEGQEQVCEQEAAQTGHLQSSSGTSRAPRAGRAAGAARRPGPLLRGTAAAPRTLCPSASRHGQRDEAAAPSRANTPAQGHRSDSASWPQPACGRAKPAIRRPQRGAPYPGNVEQGLRGALPRCRWTQRARSGRLRAPIPSAPGPTASRPGRRRLARRSEL